ncbi:hypothetical protein C8Q80DRAFT_1122863 [Daedaleopsis nitida]|nr:hypothetical protein C8Q80DRAFT_1122863 [Daedaleopsis nitida]
MDDDVALLVHILAPNHIILKLTLLTGSAESFFAIRVASAIAFAILYYDYTLTFGHEFERFWKRPFSLAAFGYYLNRYLSLLGHVPVIFEIYGHHSRPISVGTLQIYRVYGLYERSRKVLYLLVVTAVTSCIVCGWATSHTWTASRPDNTESSRIIDECDLRMSKLQKRYLAIAWGMVLICDVMIFTLTSFRVLQVGKKWRGSLFTLMLRDGIDVTGKRAGTLYFGYVSTSAGYAVTQPVALNVELTVERRTIGLFSCVISPIFSLAWLDRSVVWHEISMSVAILKPPQPAFRGISVTTTNVIATTMIARLMLNVRDPDLIEGRYRESSTTDLSSALTECCFEMRRVRSIVAPSQDQ